MKIQNEQRIVETDGFENKPKEFTIKQNARAYEILSSNIYSDKILAVVREYGTNALDAMISAGRGNEPFEVHLPNTFEPFFHVRDFGPGLSDEDVYNVYTQYFNSTKDNDNDVTGCLGLGSKSAFAYTDQFTITSRHKGRKSVYTAYMNEDGTPAVTCIIEAQDSNGEPDGLEIHVPVKAEDFSTFVDRAQKIYHRFPVLPTITGNKVDMTQVKYRLVGPNYKIRESEYNTSSYRYGRQSTDICYAVQGSVAYPIEASSLNSLDRNSPLHQIINAPIDIVFPIGELNITASRERLNYDKNTQANIIAALQSVADHVPNHVKGVLAGAATLWEAKLLYDKWINNDGHGGYLKQIVQGKLEWNGIKIQDNRIKIEMFNLVPKVDPLTNKTLFSTVNTDPKTGKPLPVMVQEPWGYIHTYGGESLRNDKYGPGKAYETSIYAKENVIIVYEDERMKAPNQTIRHNYAGMDQVVLIKCDASKLPDVIKAMGSPPYVNSSTLADPPKKATAPRISAVRKLQVVKQFRNYGGHDLSETDIDVADGGIYVMAYDGNLLKPGHELDPSSLGTSNTVNHLLYGLQNLGFFKDLTICRINSTYKGSIPKDDNWKTIFNYMEPLMNRVTDKSNVKALSAILYLGYLYESGENDILSLAMDYEKQEWPRHFKPNSAFVKMMTKLEEFRVFALPFVEENHQASMRAVASSCADYVKQTGYANEIGMKVERLTEVPQYQKMLMEFKKDFTALKTKYVSLLKMADRYDNNTGYESMFKAHDVINYIQLSDAKRSSANTTKGN